MRTQTSWALQALRLVASLPRVRPMDWLYLCVLQQRAAMRVYAPGGVGFHLAQASFEGKV